LLETGFIKGKQQVPQQAELQAALSTNKNIAGKN